MRSCFAVLGLCVACLVLGDDGARQKVRIDKTEKMDFPANGTLQMQNSTGELIIEGWDQPGFEITTTRSSKETYPAGEREKATQELDRVRISTKREGDALVVTTDFPHHRAFPYVTPLSTVTNFDLSYRIKVPRSAKLIVKHEDGDVLVDDVTGNIQMTARQGLITLRLTGEVPPAIDAKSGLGSVTSDFAGDETRHPWPFGHKFIENAKGVPQHLQLKIGFGDIIILKAHEPKAPTPAS